MKLKNTVLNICIIMFFFSLTTTPVFAEDWRLVVGEDTGSFYGFKWVTDWDSDSDTASGLPDLGDGVSPTIFQYEGVFYLISGKGVSTGFGGYNWTGSTWQVDSVITSGIGSLGGYTKPHVFEKDDILYLIVGKTDGTYAGYNWTGSTWQVDSSIISGLTDVGTNPAPTVFEKDNVWYLISGSGVGTFAGYKWGASTWASDTDIVSGLGDIGSASAPTIFYKDSTWYLISGEYDNFVGYNWTGSAWQSDSSIISGLSMPGKEYLKPCAFEFTVIPTPTPTPTATEPPIAAPPPVLPPTPIPPIIPPEEPVLEIIIEEFIDFISTSYNWIFILLAYFGALLGKILSDPDIDDTTEILVDTALYGTIAWIIILIINFFIPILSVDKYIVMFIFVIAGFIFALLANIDTQPKKKSKRR